MALCPGCWGKAGRVSWQGHPPKGLELVELDSEPVVLRLSQPEGTEGDREDRGDGDRGFHVQCCWTPPSAQVTIFAPASQNMLLSRFHDGLQSPLTLSPPSRAKT